MVVLGNSGLFYDGLYIKLILNHFQILGMMQSFQVNSDIDNFITTAEIVGDQ